MSNYVRECDRCDWELHALYTLSMGYKVPNSGTFQWREEDMYKLIAGATECITEKINTVQCVAGNFNQHTHSSWNDTHPRHPR